MDIGSVVFHREDEQFGNVHTDPSYFSNDSISLIVGKSLRFLSPKSSRNLMVVLKMMGLPSSSFLPAISISFRSRSCLIVLAESTPRRLSISLFATGCL